MNLYFEILIWGTYLISLYFSIFWLIVLILHWKQFKSEEEEKIALKQFPLVSIIVPAFNEEKFIVKTMESILKLKYPIDKIELIAVDDGSTDNTLKKMNEVKKKYADRKIHVCTQKNGGKAVALNKGLALAKGKFFACLDADSYVAKETLQKMLYTFEKGDDNLAIVTPMMFVNKPKTLLQKFQNAEYITTQLILRMMSKMDCIYIAPGPFSVYRTKVIKALKGFDEDNITEDQEIAYRVQTKHYTIRHCPHAYVFTNTPPTLKHLYKQRNRWFKGTLMNLFKYKHLIMNHKYGDFGLYQLPLVGIAFLLGILGVTMFSYYVIWPFLKFLKNLYLIGFDITSLFVWEPTFSLLDPQYGKTFMIILVFFLAFIMFYVGHKNAQKSVREQGIVYVLPYFFLYYVLLGCISIIVLIEVALGRVQKW